ncbi:MAG: hypothetical protein DYG98_12775 [Haliscomenobacteraceae bacterium CHB4]|nr:hypothetical protein [Saprospiraceae bacterium]MCE7923925.1 hypothetical protein [Haliscomenobacteraceae bacterium CHB4]
MENSIAFGIKGIEVVNTVIKAPAEAGTVSKFNFEMQFRAIANPKEKVVTIFSDVVIKDEERNVQIGQYSALFHYGVDDLDNLIVGNGHNQIEIPQPLLTTLLGISVSTLRGMMFEAFRGTFLHGGILPVVDIMAIQPLVPMPN